LQSSLGSLDFWIMWK